MRDKLCSLTLQTIWFSKVWFQNIFPVLYHVPKEMSNGSPTPLKLPFWRQYYDSKYFSEILFNLFYLAGLILKRNFDIKLLSLQLYNIGEGEGLRMMFVLMF